MGVGEVYFRLSDGGPHSRGPICDGSEISL